MENNTQLVNASNLTQTDATRSIRRALRRLCRDTRGASFVEYLVLVGVIALAGMAAMDKLAKGIDSKAGAQQTAIGKIPG
ncbi:MAG TPA: hypothetical protein VIV60_02675 [Polyangiaceae bacterium]